MYIHVCPCTYMPSIQGGIWVNHMCTCTYIKCIVHHGVSILLIPPHGDGVRMWSYPLDIISWGYPHDDISGGSGPWMRPYGTISGPSWAHGTYPHYIALHVGGACVCHIALGALGAYIHVYACTCICIHMCRHIWIHVWRHLSMSKSMD